MKRREFLNLGLSSAGAFAISSLLPLHKLLAKSQNRLAHYLITVRVPGGWDTSLCMDPWTQNERPPQDQFYIEYRQDELITIDGRFFGPGLKPLRPYLNRATVINGIFLSNRDNGHDAAQLYVETGSGEGHLGNFNIELEGLGFNSALGVMINTGVKLSQRMSSVWDGERTRINKKIEPADLIFDDERAGSFVDLAKSALLNNGDRIAHFNQLIELAGKQHELSIYDIVVNGLSSGLSQSSSLGLTTSLDTHSNHPKTHLEVLAKGFGEVKTLLDKLQTTPSFYDPSKSLLDTTTVIVFSEFTRTPALNASQGKDHNPQCNSMLIFSPLFKPMTIGGSNLIQSNESTTGKALLGASPLHRQSFEPMSERSETFILRPENIYATLASAIGLQPAAISPNFEDRILLKPLIK